MICADESDTDRLTKIFGDMLPRLKQATVAKLGDAGLQRNKIIISKSPNSHHKVKYVTFC
jgi:hypothetical protein